jgi:hypothetical protein
MPTLKSFSQTLGSRQASCSAMGTKGDRYRSSCVVVSLYGLAAQQKLEHHYPGDDESRD